MEKKFTKYNNRLHTVLLLSFLFSFPPPRLSFTRRVQIIVSTMFFNAIILVAFSIEMLLNDPLLGPMRRGGCREAYVTGIKRQVVCMTHARECRNARAECGAPSNQSTSYNRELCEQWQAAYGRSFDRK